MYSEYEQLLSYKDIDSSVDELYRLWLDTKLMELTHKHHAEGGSARGYWEAVLKLRKDELDPYTPLENLTSYVPGPTDEKQEEALRREAKAQADADAGSEGLNKFSYARGFLYWFDVRAEFWSLTPPSAVLDRVLPPSGILERLYHRAKIVDANLTDLTGLAGAAAQPVDGRAHSTLEPVMQDEESSVVRGRRKALQRLAGLTKSEAKKTKSA